MLFLNYHAALKLHNFLITFGKILCIVVKKAGIWRQAEDHTDKKDEAR